MHFFAISGNSAMTYILLGKDPDDLATAPYTLSYTGGNEEKLNSNLPPAYISPLLAPFVGADISAGLTAIEHGGSPNIHSCWQTSAPMANSFSLCHLINVYAPVFPWDQLLKALDFPLVAPQALEPSPGFNSPPQG